MMLFSDCPETHTYVITLPFYAMAFWLQPQRTWIDWTLFWLLVINFCILPADVLCPSWLHEYIHKTFWLDVYTYFICLLRILWLAVAVSVAGFLNVGCVLDRNIRIGGSSGHLSAPVVGLVGDLAVLEYL